MLIINSLTSGYLSELNSYPISFKMKPILKNNQNDLFISSALSDSLRYVRTYTQKMNSNGIKVHSILQFNPEKLTGILDGLTTFNNFKADDIALLNNILIINTQRGCNNGCGHCYLLAKPTGVFKESTIPWESYKQILNDFATLNSRLGFNTLGNKFGFAYNYADSDPIEFCSIDKLGAKHNIAEAAEYFYKKIAKPIDFSTAGWDIDNEFENNAAKDIVNLVQKNPDTLRGVDVSIHPFHKLMLRANAYHEKSIILQETNPQLAQIYKQKYLDTRTTYVERMANVLKTFAPIMKPGYFHIDSQYIFEENPHSIFSKEDTKMLCKDILLRTKELCQNENIDSYIITHGLEAFQAECMYPPRKVYNTPRIKSNPNIEFPNTYSVEIHNDKMDVIVEPFDKTFYNFFENEIAENIEMTLSEYKNSFSKIIINIDLGNNISTKLLEAKFLNNEEALENYYERLENTINIFSRIPKNKLKLRIKYDIENPGIMPVQEVIDFLNQKYPNLSNIELKTKDSISEECLSQKNPTEEIVNMLEHLSPQARRNFIIRMKKAIDIDGNLVLMIYNKPYFGTGNFQAISIKLDDLILNMNQTKKDQKFENLLHIKV